VGKAFRTAVPVQSDFLFACYSDPKNYHDNGLDDYDDHKGDYDHSYKSYKIVEGTKKDDYLHGSDKNEIFLAGKGSDHVYGDGGKDYIFGQEGKDYLYGDRGDDHLYGGKGNDELHGGKDNDWLYGDNGNDKLWGDDGKDYLYGGKGDDWLYGGKGNDDLYGGEGKDTFVFDKKDSGYDTVYDYDEKKDDIDVNGVKDKDLHYEYKKGDTYVTWGDHDSSIKLVGIHLDDHHIA